MTTHQGLLGNAGGVVEEFRRLVRQTKPIRLLTCASLVLVISIGLSLRIANLGKASLWLDEAATAALVTIDWGSFWKVLFSREMNMAAYYCILRMIPPLHNSEALLRLLSVIFGTAVIVAVWFLAENLLTESKSRPIWAIAAASLVAVNGFLVAYSQEARGYAMALCLVVLATCAAITVVRKGKLRSTWCLLSLAAIYSHFYAMLWIAPQAWAIWKANRQRERRFFAPIVLITSFGLIPLLVFAVKTRGGQLDWVPQLTLAHFLNIFVQLAGYSRIALIVIGIGSLAGSVRFYKRGDILSRMIVFQNLLPVTLLLVASALHPVFIARFLIFAIPFLVLTAVEAFSGLHPIVAAILVVPTLALMLFASNRGLPKGDWREMAGYLCEQRDQAIAFWPSMQKFPYWYYTQASHSCAEPLSPPGRNVSVSDFRPNRQEFESRLCASQAERVLVVVDSGSGPQKMSEIRASCYLLASTTSRNGLQVFQLRRISAHR